MSSSLKKPSVLNGALLVSGTAIGAGMLALPVVTAEGGFLPSLLIYLLCWACMSITGLFLLEGCLRMKKEVNIISLAEHYLGLKGKIIAWVLYIFLFYSLSIAYISVGGALLGKLLHLPPFLGSLLFVLFFGFFVFKGAFWVDKMNVVLMIGLLLSYLVFLSLGGPEVDVVRLRPQKWGISFLALPVIFTSFSYQGIIPSLTNYLQRDKKKLRKAILLGTSSVFVMYIIWQIIVLGSVPLEGKYGLLEAKKLGETAIYPFQALLQAPFLYSMGMAFSFFAITTSFLGVTLGLFDFLSDGLSLHKKGANKGILLFLTYFPPFLVQAVYPAIFLKALGYAGGIGCALLLGFLPTWILYKARYIRKEPFPCVIPSNKIVFYFVFAFIFFELGIEFYKELFFS